MLDARAFLPALAEPRDDASRAAAARPDPESERRVAKAELLCRRPLARVKAGDSERWPLVDVPVGRQPSTGSNNGVALPERG